VVGIDDELTTKSAVNHPSSTTRTASRAAGARDRTFALSPTPAPFADSADICLVVKAGVQSCSSVLSDCFSTGIRTDRYLVLSAVDEASIKSTQQTCNTVPMGYGRVGDVVRVWG